jgi:hypothetical protein
MHKKAALLLVLFLAFGVFLGTSRTASAQEDPPTRVARLNFIEGSVSYQPGGDEDSEWVAADRNRPLTTGDDLWSDQDSRGEVHIGSTAIRLGPQTGISFLNLDDNTIQIQLTQGVIDVHIRHYNPDNAYEIDTPNLAFTIYAPGKYRIQTDPDGYSTMILVRDGQGQATGAGQTFDINPQQAYTFSGGEQLTYDVQPAGAPDEFEHWSESRDLREDASASARYVSPDMDGYYDLDDNGDWQNDPEYGSVWIPRNVASGWAPYHDGHWVWIAPWGWTWVDAQPWGFAPFHYGRWAQVRGGYWGWVPGPPAVRPVYAPALVAFVGGGPGFGTSIGFGGGFAGVAWFPLGPRDVFVPSYRTSAAYVQNVNVSNTRVVNVTQVTNVYNTYRVNNTTINNVTVNKINYTYANNPAAVTAVSRETFVGARPVAASAVRVTPQQLQTVRIAETTTLAPTRASYISSTARVTPAAAAPRVAFAQTKVVARIAPPAPPARPGAAPRVAPPIISAGVAPKGDRAAAHTNPAGAAVKANQPPPRAANTNARPPSQPAGQPANQPTRNAPAAAQPTRPAPPAPSAQPQPAERTNSNQPRPAPQQPVNRPAEVPAERPAPTAPPAKNPPPVNSRDNQRDDQRNDQRNDQRDARPPAQPQPKPEPQPPAARPQAPPPPAVRPQPQPVTPAPQTAAEAKEKQKQADKAKKDEEKKDKDKPKNQPQR